MACLMHQQADDIGCKDFGLAPAAPHLSQPDCCMLQSAGVIALHAGPLIQSAHADKTRLEWGGLISTCNQLTGSPIEVETDAPLLWTTTVPS